MQIVVCQGLGIRRKDSQPLNVFGLLLRRWNVLSLDRGGGCITLNVPNITKLLTLKLLILCYVSFTSIFKMLKILKVQSKPVVLLKNCSGEWILCKHNSISNSSPGRWLEMLNLRLLHWPNESVWILRRPEVSQVQFNMWEAFHWHAARTDIWTTSLSVLFMELQIDYCSVSKLAK